MPINSFLYPSPSTPSFGYNVANSLRFNDGSSDSLTKSFSGSGNRRTWTVSVWFKLSLIPPASRLFSIGNDASSDILSAFFTSGETPFTTNPQIHVFGALKKMKLDQIAKCRLKCFHF